MRIKTTLLDNGLKIVTASMAEMRSQTVVFSVGAGSRHEDFPVNGGVSHFLEHLLFKGSQHYPTAQLVSTAVDSVGGSNNAYTTQEYTSFYIKLPSENSDLALDILSDMIRRPLMDTAEVDRERGVIIEEMNLYRDDPAQFVHTLLPELIFSTNPLGRDVIGSEKVVGRIPVSDIHSYLAKHYVPNNMVVSVSGEVDHDIVVRRLKELLGDMQPAKLSVPAPVSALFAAETVKTVVKDTAQTHFVLGSRGYSYNDERSKVARVLSAVLGMGMSCRLFTKVREEQGLAYNIYADHVQFTDSGLFSVYAGVTLDKAGQAVTSVMRELARVTEEPVGGAELSKAKKQLVAALEMSMESNSAVADRLATQSLLLGRVKPLKETVEEINSVTADDIIVVAKEMLAPENLRLAVIAPNPAPLVEEFKQLIKS